MMFTFKLLFGLSLCLAGYCQFDAGFEGRACPGIQTLRCMGESVNPGVSWETRTSTTINTFDYGFARPDVIDPLTLQQSIVSTEAEFSGLLSITYSPNGGNSFSFDTTYSIQTTAPRTTVSCIDGSTVFGSVVIEFAYEPSEPRMFALQSTQTSTDSASVTVQWEPPTDNGGRDDLSYIVTISPPAQLSASVVTSTSVTVTDADYNVDYTVSVVATNCAGTSEPRQYSFRIDACEQPSTPLNSSIGQVLGREVGATVTFQCDSGFSPTQAMTTTCVDSLTWSPDPETFRCTALEGTTTDFFSRSSFTGLDITLSVVVSATVSVLIGIALGVCCACWQKRAGKAYKIEEPKVPLPYVSETTFISTAPPLPTRPPPIRSVTPDYEEVATGTSDSELNFNSAYRKPVAFY